LRGAMSLVESAASFLLTWLDFLVGLVFYPIQWARWCYYFLRVMARTGYDKEGQNASVKKVVIVGANFAGLSALHEFVHDPNFHVVLIDQRDYFEYTPGVLRLFCEPRLFNSLARRLPRGSHESVLGTVTVTNSDHVVVADRGGATKTVYFDYLILATGADYRQPVTATPKEWSLQSRSTTWQREAAKVKEAQRILVLGGGAVGTELAAEIAHYYPHKKVTIVDALPHLVPLFPSSTVKYVEDWFMRQGVELVLGETLKTWDEKSCTTASGRVIPADLVFVCFGLRCNSQSVVDGDMADRLSDRREVEVDEHLKVCHSRCVFAAGDVMAHPSREIKQAYYAEMNGKLAALNVIRSAHGQSLMRYPEDIAGAQIMPLVYVVSLGPCDGSLGFNEVVVNGTLAAMVKWFIEWTKVAQMEGRPLGALVWGFGDAVTFFLSRTLVKPRARQD